MLENARAPVCECTDANGFVIYDQVHVCAGPPKEPGCKAGETTTGSATRSGPGAREGAECSGVSSSASHAPARGKLSNCSTCSFGRWPNNGKRGSPCEGVTLRTGERKSGTLVCY